MRDGDLRDHLNGEVSESLRDENTFSKAYAETGTVAWRNGADFAPEFLREIGREAAFAAARTG